MHCALWIVHCEKFCIDTSHKSLIVSTDEHNYFLGLPHRIPTVTQTVLITGASTGFGKAAALHFATNGRQVVATMRDSVARTDLTANSNSLVIRIDVQDPASIDRAITEAIAHFGGIDALVNNAGIGLFGIFEGASREKIQEQFDVNVFGVMDVTRAMLPHFRTSAHVGTASS